MSAALVAHRRRSCSPSAARFLVAVVAALACAAVAAQAAPPESAASPSQGNAPASTAPQESPAAIRFRRIYAPIDRLEEWPLGKETYLPVDPAEFEARVAAVAAATGGQESHGTLGLRQAEYRAQLVGEQLTDGMAEIDVVQATPSPTLVSLQPCNLAIREATWIEADPTPALAGLGPTGQWSLLVERPGRLQFQWSLRGQRRDAGELLFDLRFPRCPLNRLVLDLPQQLRPEPDRGLLLEPTDAGDGYRRWTLELGGHCATMLRAVAADSPQAARPQPVLRQSAVYRLADEGLDLALQWTLDAPRASLNDLSAALDPGLEIVAARLGDQPVRWQVIGGGNGARNVRFEFPSPVQGQGQVLHVMAVAPLVLQNTWLLPSVRPEGMVWQEGTARVTVPASLDVNACRAIDGEQSGAGGAPSGESGEWYEFELFSPDAHVEMVLARRTAEVHLTSGAAVEIRAGAMTGQIQADYTALRGEVFTLAGEVAKQWLIDSVETEPAAALDDWTFDRTGSPAILRVYLAQALTPQRPIRVRIGARRLHSPLGRTLSVNDVVPVRLPAQGSPRRLVAIRASGPYDLQLVRADMLPRLQFSALPAAEQSLFAEPPTGLFFAQGAEADSVQITLMPERPGYEAKVEMEAVASGAALVESCRIGLAPESAPIDRVVVHLVPPDDAPVRWTVGAAGETPLSAQRRLLDPQRDSSVSVPTEQWDIRLRQAQSQAIELRATRSVPFDRPRGVTLAWLPEATRQRATLTIRSLGPDNVRVENRRLEPVPADLWPPSRYPTVRGMFRYDAAHRAASATEPDIVVQRAPAADASAWAWNCRLESVYDGQGGAQHTIDYQIQNSGARNLTLAMPSGLQGEVRGVWIDGHPAIWQRTVRQGRWAVRIALPQERRFPSVRLCFTTTGEAFSHLGRLAPPLPSANLPVLTKHWTVWLPPGYRFRDRPADDPGRLTAARWWSVRLFGPFGRDDDQAVFDPLAPHPELLPEKWHAVAACDTLARELVESVAAEAAEAKPADWTTVIGRAQTALPHLRWWIDLEGLSEAGIAPDLPVATGNPARHDASLLQRAGIALLVDKPRVVVTTAARVAQWSEQVRPCGQAPVWFVRPGPLAAWLAEEEATQGRLFIPAAHWTPLAVDRPPPWTTSPGSSAADLHGWAAIALDCSADRPVRVGYVRRATLQLTGGIALLASAVLGIFLAARRPGLWIVTAAALAIGALTIDPVWLPLGSGGVLGLLAGWLAQRLWGRAKPRHEHSAVPEQGASPAGVRALGVLAGAMLLLGGTPAAGADAPAQQPKTWSVFIPVDAQQHPTGEKYQVPSEFYNELHRLAASAAKRPEGWLLGSAVYSGTVQWQASPPRPSAVDLRATYSLHVFGAGTQVRLAIAREGANLLPEGTLLDGRPVPAEWTPEGDALLFDVAEAGDHRLEVAMRPTLRFSESATELCVTIPPLALSRLEMKLPSGTVRPELPSASGAVIWQESAPQLQADLGPVGSLRVRWPAAGAGEASAAIDVQELLWLKIAPGAVVLETRLKFRAAQGPVRQVEVLADPRLRLYEDHLPAPSVQATPGGFQRIRFELAPAAGQEAALSARFLLTGTSGVGYVRLPYLEPVGARRTRRWLAVSVDPSLSYLPLPEATATALGVPEFLTAWGPAEPAPTLACGLDAPDTPWGVATRRTEMAAQADSTLHLGFSPDQLEARFLADVNVENGVAFQFRLAAPPELEIHRISLMQDSAQRLLRWSREESGAVTLFLNGPVSGLCRLELTGSTRFADPAAVHPPLVRLEKIPPRAYRVQLYRRPSALVAVDKVEGLSALGVAAVPNLQADLGRAIDTLAAEGPDAPALVVRVTPNQPTVEAAQMTWLLRREGAWWAQIDVTLSVAGGALDQIVLETPPAWNGPFQAAPSLSLTPETADGIQRLVVRPRDAWSGSVRFSVLGPVTTDPSGWVAVPPIRLRGIEPRSRLVGVPAGPSDQPLWWDTRGLSLTELPEEFPPPAELEAPTIFSLQDDDFQAVLRPGQPRQSTSEVHLAEMVFAWESDGRCRGSALFDLEPGGLAECPLWLPRGLKLLQVSVDGVPAPLRTAGENRWIVPLASTVWPQRVEVLVEGKPIQPVASGRLRLDAPSLGSLPVRQFLWTIYAPSGTPHGNVEGSAPLEPLLYELTRLKTTSALIELQSYSVAADTPDMLPWYRLWLERLSGLETAVERELSWADASQPIPSVRAELDAVRRKEQLLRDRLGETAPPRSDAAEARQAVSPAELWQAARGHDRTSIRCIGQIGSIAVNYPSAAAGAVALPVGSILGVLACAIVALVGLRRGIWQEWLDRWPAGTGVLAGLAWWLWLQPSVLGLVIVALSLLATVHRGLWRPAHSTGSSILRVR